MSRSSSVGHGLSLSTMQFVPTLRTRILRRHFVPALCKRNLRQHLSPQVCAADIDGFVPQGEPAIDINGQIALDQRPEYFPPDEDNSLKDFQWDWQNQAKDWLLFARVLIDRPGVTRTLEIIQMGERMAITAKASSEMAKAAALEALQTVEDLGDSEEELNKLTDCENEAALWNEQLKEMGQQWFDTSAAWQAAAELLEKVPLDGWSPAKAQAVVNAAHATGEAFSSAQIDHYRDAWAEAATQWAKAVIQAEILEKEGTLNLKPINERGGTELIVKTVSNVINIPAAALTGVFVGSAVTFSVLRFGCALQA